MIFRIHFSYEHVDDYIDIEGSTIEEIKYQAFKEMNKRGVDTAECWSEKLQG